MPDAAGRGSDDPCHGFSSSAAERRDKYCPSRYGDKTNNSLCVTRPVTAQIFADESINPSERRHIYPRPGTLIYTALR